MVELIREWFSKADNDYGAAEYLFGRRPTPVDVICFLCRQAAEKWLKAYLIAKGIDEPPKTHNLSTLRELCSDIDTQFEFIIGECDTLTPYGVVVRYPSELNVSELDARRAFDYATAVRNIAPLSELRNEITESAVQTEALDQDEQSLS
jgi:HEPN domain-containing protein